MSNKGAWGSNLDQIWPKIDQTRPEKVKTGQIGQARPLFQPFEGTEHEICIKTSKNGTWMLDLDQNGLRIDQKQQKMVKMGQRSQKRQLFHLV